LDIAFALHERGVPRHIALMARQVGIELAMCGAIKRHPLEFTVFMTLIGIEESGPPKKYIRNGMSMWDHVWEILTETLD
jgi:hypothetical protein